MLEFASGSIPKQVSNSLRIDCVHEECFAVLVSEESCQRITLLVRDLLELVAVLHESLFLLEKHLLSQGQTWRVCSVHGGPRRWPSHREWAKQNLVNLWIMLWNLLWTLQRRTKLVIKDKQADWAYFYTYEIVLEYLDCHLKKLFVIGHNCRR